MFKPVLALFFVIIHLSIFQPAYAQDVVFDDIVKALPKASFRTLPATLDKAREARKMIDESGYDIRLEIDGGVSGANIKEVAEAGVDMFVAGSAIFRDPRTEEAYKKTIDAMRDELAAAKVPANKVAA